MLGDYGAVGPDWQLGMPRALRPCLLRAPRVRRGSRIHRHHDDRTRLGCALPDGVVPEYGREYFECRSAGAGAERPWSTDEFVRIAEEQVRREDLGALVADP